MKNRVHVLDRVLAEAVSLRPFGLFCMGVLLFSALWLFPLVRVCMAAHVLVYGVGSSSAVGREFDDAVARIERFAAQVKAAEENRDAFLAERRASQAA